MSDYIKFITIICGKFLNIPVPEIVITDKMLSGTNLAYADIANHKIFVKDRIENKLDAFFAIAHELRHIWQSVADPELLTNHESAEEIGIEAYNLQPAEIDANAFGMFCMITGFDRQPLFQGMTENVRNKIFERFEEIYKE